MSKSEFRRRAATTSNRPAISRRPGPTTGTVRDRLRARAGREDGSALVYLIFASLIIIGISSVMAYLTSNMAISRHRAEMVVALHYAEGGVAAACYDLEKAYLGSDGTASNLVSRLCSNSPTAYLTNTTLTSSSQYVCQRSITNLFASQPVTVQLWITNSGFASKVQIASTANYGSSSQTVRPNASFKVTLGAAIISDSPGSSDTSANKGIAQKGNVCLNGDNSYNTPPDSYGPTTIDGGILANGAVNAHAAQTGVIAQHLQGTSDQVPDYTNPGSTNQLFDFNRFIVASTVSSNHFTTVKKFIDAVKTNTVANPREGIVVVDIATGDGDRTKITSGTFPNGINIRGTLFFNFLSGWKSTDKITTTATYNINQADLTGLNIYDPTTFTSGYPPAYSSPSKRPCVINTIPYGYPKFDCSDDLPALMYNNAVLDIHGGCNISGVIYSPSFVEIENHGTRQYIKGTIITGGGIFIDNNGNAAGNVVSYDPNAIDFLATAGTLAKAIVLDYWTR